MRISTSVGFFFIKGIQGLIGANVSIKRIEVTTKLFFAFGDKHF